jgi:1-deoxy-D-xylulose-5-phosphate synthase
MPQLITTFSSLHQLPGPVLVHVVTKKGKGYSFAEKNAEKFHGVGSFYKTTGDSRSGKGSKKYSKVFGEALTAMARSDDRIVAITAAMKEGTGLTCFADEFPDRFFDVGISEQHAVTFAAGLARDGMKPYVAIYSTFLQRGFDQVIHDVALQKLPVRFILDRAGIVGEDGPTHHGTFDLSYMGMIPGMIVMAPSNECDMTRMLLTTGEIDSGPSALRFPRGSVEGVDMSSCEQPVEIGKAKVLSTGDDATLIAIGSMTGPALKAAELISAKGIETSVIDARFAKPIDSEVIIGAASGKGPVFVIEENAVSGGFGDAVARLLSREGILAPVIRIGIGDMFVPHGGREELLDEQGLSAAKIAEKVISTISTTDPGTDGGSR